MPTNFDSRPDSLSAPDADSSVDSDALKSVLHWLLGVTKPVHAPLAFSICMRIISQIAYIALFALAGGGIVAIMLETPLPLLGIITPWKLALCLITLALLKAVTYYLEQFSGHYVAFKALELLRGKAFSMLWPKAPGIVARSRSGVLYASLTRDIDRIEVLYAHTIAPVIAGVVVPIGAVFIGYLAFGWQPMLAPSLCVAASVFIVPVLGLRAGMQGAAQTLALRAQLTQHVTDSVFGAAEVTGYGQEQRRFSGMDTLSDQVTQTAKVPAFYRGLRRGVNAAFVPLSVAGAVLGGIWAGLSPESVALLASGCLAFFEASRGLEDAAGGVDLSLASARRLYAVCHAPDPVQDGELSVPDESLSVEWKDVHYAYPGERRREVLAGFTLSVPAGGHAVISGSSGCGKSTAVQLLLRYDDPSSGEILLGGRSVQDYALDSLRSAVAFVPQRADLLRGSIAENLRLGAPNASDEQLWEALRIAHIDDDVRKMPHGLEELAGTEGAGLSGGQIQRIVLARAFLTQPKVLVLDEFTANLPEALDVAIRADLARAYPQLTIIEVTHRLPATDVTDAANRSQIVKVVL